MLEALSLQLMYGSITWKALKIGPGIQSALSKCQLVLFILWHNSSPSKNECCGNPPVCTQVMYWCVHSSSTHPLPPTLTATTISRLRNYDSFIPGLLVSTLAPYNLLPPTQEERAFKSDYAPLLLQLFSGSTCKFLTQSPGNRSHLRLIALFRLLVCLHPSSRLKTWPVVNS